MPRKAKDCRIRFAASAHLFLVDRESLVFSDETREIYALNTAATYAWCALAEGESVEAVARFITAHGQLEPLAAERAVEALLSRWEDLGLTDRGRGTAAAVVTPPRLEARPSSGTAPVGTTASLRAVRGPWIDERRYRLLDLVVAIRYSRPEQVRWVHPVFSHLADRDREPVGLDVAIVGREDEYVVVVDGTSSTPFDDVRKLGPWIKFQIIAAAVRHRAPLLGMHAGVVSDGNQCVMFPAASGSGKTSLTATLAASDWTYYSDEVAVLSADTGHVSPVPVSMSVKVEGTHVLQPSYPHLARLPVHQREDGKRVRYLPPPSRAMPEPDESRPVSHLVFPRYDPNALTLLRPLGRVEALRRVLDECLALPHDLDLAKATALVNWLRSVTCYELPMSSLATAVRLVEGLGSEPERASADA